MDIGKLEKMKVADLRNELQSRGLDTKGVKAVLIERLRSYLQSEHEESSGSASDVSTSTPSKRGRRTRSMTKSPSPPIIKSTEIVLETLNEETNNSSLKEQQISEEEEEQSVAEVDADADSPTISNYMEKADSIAAEEEQQSSELENADVNANAETEAKKTEQHEPAHIDEKVEEELEKMEESIEALPIKEQSVETENKIAETNVEPMEQDEVTEEPTKLAESKEKSATETKSDNANADDVEQLQEDVVKTREKERHDKKSRSRSRSPSVGRLSRDRDRDFKIGFSAEDMTSVAEDEPLIEDKQFGLSWYDSDLHLSIDPLTFNSAKQLSHDIFSLIWSGARTNYGVRQGKVCYEVRLSEETSLSKSHRFRNEPHLRGFRVGFSLANSACLQLGESETSFAFCESGHKAINSAFNEYGKPFALDDVIGCYLNLESSPCTIKYTLNGEDLGVAFEFEKDILGENEALFPHVLCKGYEFEVNFADNDNLLVNAERPTRRRLIKKESKLAVIEKDEDEKMEEKPTENAEENQSKKEKSTEKEIETESEKSTKEEGKSENNVKEAPQKKANKAASENSDWDDDDSNGPSPDKRAKLDDDDEKEKSNSNEKADKTAASSDAEDEYENVAPEHRDSMDLLPGYELIALIPEEQYIAGAQRPESRSDCKVIIMIGLPGSGKTHWVQQHIKDHPEKRYHVIGADALIAKMTIDGKPRKTVHKGSWDTVYESCINSLALLEEIAVKRRRNFILDQTNVYASVQRRKMKGFANFKRTAVVCVPNEEELKRRNEEKKEKGDDYTVKEGTLNNLKANFSLPSLDFAWFDEIIYTDLSDDDAKAEIKKINEKGKKDVGRDKNRNRSRDYPKRDDRRQYDDRRRDFRPDNRWSDRRSSYGQGGGGGNPGMGGTGGHNGYRWGPMGGGGGGGSGGNGMMGGYHRSGSGWREPERGYGGGNMRGYDRRPPQRYYGGQQQPNQSNWAHNNRNRYDDRFNRSGGVSRFDSYGGGGGGGRDYRDRERDRNGGGGGGGPRRDNYRNLGGGGGNQQRDFRQGHRDNRVEDSRGGYERSTSATSASSKYSNPAHTAAGSGYDQYKSDGAQSKSGKWNNSYGQYQNQMPHQQSSYYQQQHANNWQQQPEHNQYQQQQQQYWNYGNMQAYGQQSQQQPWNANDASQQQQQEWMAYWQQQQQAQGGGADSSADAAQYWSQYMYSNQTATATPGAGAEVAAESNTEGKKRK